ncbi:glycerophosphodiester phosphodiesterase [Luteolibacter ambystomatis]|uniref:Glycerophosphodiester phosphodiesterase n=1 Tax=Luteolibacter ambystomatis TaxID=2824561 RepID=A0A975IXR3_9BACT|nr:glycerophosphodiester phosphodiesterase [Luteolibacter ambystomatis]QUE49606.1 glycerophosphodiester phosphodiesterase [Luteolibacter ambystomatis]
MPVPLFIAHRGASDAAPENTLAAFRMAWDEGADGIEGDFRLTADGKVVCIHDANTGRTAGKRHTVERCHWKTLAGLDVGSWKGKRFAGERIPLLEEVLETMPEEKRLFIEIKSGPKIIDPLVEALETQHADPERIVLMSFDSGIVSACRERMPAYQSHLIHSLKGVAKPEKAAAYAAEFKQCGAQGLQFDCKAHVSAKWLAALKCPLTSWTVNDVRAARKVIALGVNFITTNKPAELRARLGM